MKPITLGNEQWYYVIDYHSNDGYAWPYTGFFKQMKTVPKWKFLWWKSKETKKVPDIVFTVDMDIEDPKYNKVEVRRAIGKYFRVCQRQKQIEKGEII